MRARAAMQLPAGRSSLPRRTARRASDARRRSPERQSARARRQRDGSSAGEAPVHRHVEEMNVEPQDPRTPEPERKGDGQTPQRFGWRNVVVFVGLLLVTAPRLSDGLLARASPATRSGSIPRQRASSGANDEREQTRPRPVRTGGFDASTGGDDRARGDAAGVLDPRCYAPAASTGVTIQARQGRARADPARAYALGPARRTSTRRAAATTAGMVGADRQPGERGRAARRAPSTSRSR